jgi:transcriptional regulator with XRE-family HTH domain
MKKPKKTASSWIDNLRTLMELRGLNPRALSLKAGLNATAVRDMLDGRVRFPRYDTVRSLATVLSTTPARLMSETGSESEEDQPFGNDLELLAEILARLQEMAEDMGRKLSPRDFAAMASTIFHRLLENQNRPGSLTEIGAHVHDLLDYDALRQKRTRPR